MTPNSVNSFFVQPSLNNSEAEQTVGLKSAIHLPNDTSDYFQMISGRLTYESRFSPELPVFMAASCETSSADIAVTVSTLLRRATQP